LFVLPLTVTSGAVTSFAVPSGILTEPSAVVVLTLARGFAKVAVERAVPPAGRPLETLRLLLEDDDVSDVSSMIFLHKASLKDSDAGAEVRWLKRVSNWDDVSWLIVVN
jgi:hypothetical protein